MNRTEDPAPDAILFDLGGVLMDFRGLSRLAELTGEDDGPALRSRWAGSRWVQAFERGACDADDFARGVVDEWGLDLAPAEFLDDFAGWPAGPFGGSVELVRSLDGSVRMGCLSNTNPIHWQQHLDRWGIVDHLEWTFVSHELGMMKPDPALFAHVVRSIGTSPDRLLLLDDSEEHVRAARRSGLRAERTRGLSEVQDALRSLLPADSDAGRALRSHLSRSSAGG